jgi:hypothetical protein
MKGGCGENKLVQGDHYDLSRELRKHRGVEATMKDRGRFAVAQRVNRCGPELVTSLGRH